VRECEKILKIEDADTYPEVNKDIVAFYYGENLNANRLKLSSKLPKKGETVWLAAPTILSVEPRLHKAKVKSASNKMLVFEYEEKDIELTATSGAPILNSPNIFGLPSITYQSYKTSSNHHDKSSFYSFRHPQ